MSKMSATEHRRCAAVGMALQANESIRNIFSIDEMLEGAKRIEVYLKGDAPIPLAKPDPTFKNEIINDVDA